MIKYVWIGIIIIIASLLPFCNGIKGEELSLMSTQQSKTIWGDEVNGLRLGLLLDQDNYKLREPIALQIHITNVSSEAVQFVETYVLREYSLEIFTAANQPVPMTAPGKKALEASESQAIYRRISVSLEPGDSYKVEPTVRLDEWFQLDAPGTYTVRVQRKGWQNDLGVLLSSSAQFSISP